MLYISSNCSNKIKIGEAIIELVNLGFRNIELTGGTKYYPNYKKEIFQLRDQYNLNYLIHNYFPPPENDFMLGLALDDSNEIKKSIKEILNAIKLTKELKIKHYAFHPGYTVKFGNKKTKYYLEYNQNDKQNKEKSIMNFYNNFETLLIKTQNYDTKIAIENLFPFNSKEDYSLFAYPAEILDFLKRYEDKKNVGILVDLGHLNVASYYSNFDKHLFLAELMSKYAHKIFEIHLSGNDGTADQHKINLKTDWQIQFLNQNKKIFQKIPITLEWHSISTKDIYDKYKQINDFLID